MVCAIADAKGDPLTAEQWWPGAESNPTAQPERIQVLLRAFAQTKIAMKEAEVPLRKWVVRRPLFDQTAYARHPKIAPLVGRVLDLWKQGEKVAVFCHYRETGRALVRHLSVALEKRLWADAARRLGLDDRSVRKAVTAFGARFDTDGGMRQPLYDEVARRLAPFVELADDQRELIQDVVRRFVRTPLFVGRYFDVQERSSDATLQAAFKTTSLGKQIDTFLKFIAKRCSPDERKQYL